jgi:hypothetical protein
MGFSSNKSFPQLQGKQLWNLRVFASNVKLAKNQKETDYIMLIKKLNNISPTPLHKEADLEVNYFLFLFVGME